jgi:AraC-like DNA-binding protein
MVQYTYDERKKKQGTLNLYYCVALQDYCVEKQKSCDYCRHLAAKSCVEFVPTVDFISISFTEQNLAQFFNSKQSNTLVDDVIHFKHTQSFSTSIGITGDIITTLQGLLNHGYTGSFENIYINAQTQMLLLKSFDSLTGRYDKLQFECKFLASAEEREKIIKARTYLLENIGDPLTIKSLSRKVAINECYLKKGFKELFGQTIFDFYQSQRMEHAKFLLYTKGLTVTEVSEKLGYSSISHFSIAFKKLTGIKPCELLMT